MPRIRDLGISVIPATMRPPEIGGGAADAYHAQCQPSGPKPPNCIPTDAPRCNPTPPQCAPSPQPPQCCPTDFQSVCSGKSDDAGPLPDDAVQALKHQLQQHIGAMLLY
jgi:hypothetical protein